MRPNNHIPDLPPDISIIIDLALNYNPSLCMADFSTIRMWIGAGCSIDLDIVPVMQTIIKTRPVGKSKINTFSYFTNPVLASHNKRIAQIKVKDSEKPLDNSALARIYAWKRNMGMWYDQIWLDAYESQNGKIFLEKRK